MSKTKSSPSPLLAVINFDALTSSTRTLSATQAFDTSRSQITLGSFTGTLTDKTNKKGPAATWKVAVASTNSIHPESTAQRNPNPEGQFESVALIVREVKNPKPAPTKGKPCFEISRLIFEGFKMGSLNPGKNITTYDGVITLALGEYKKWKDNYAVLKTNAKTEKAVLFIYGLL